MANAMWTLVEGAIIVMALLVFGSWATRPCKCPLCDGRGMKMDDDGKLACCPLCRQGGP